MRFCTIDGLRQINGTQNCPIRFQDLNDYAEAVCFGGNGTAPNLNLNEEYVVEFMTTHNPLLFQSDLTPEGTGAVQAGLSHFVSPNNPVTHRGFSIVENCTRPNGTFVPNNAMNAWNYGYETPMDWNRVSSSFVATASGVHGIYFSPNTPNYHVSTQFEWMSYFVDDIFVTPVSQNPISIETSVSVGADLTIELVLSIQTDWSGTNTQPIDINLILPPGIEAEDENNLTFNTGEIGPLATIDTLYFSFDQNSSHGVSYFIQLQEFGGCLNHIPCIQVDYPCIDPLMTIVTLFPECNPVFLTAEISSADGFTFNWIGPDTFNTTAQTIQPMVVGQYFVPAILPLGICTWTDSIYVSALNNSENQLTGFTVSGNSNTIYTFGPEVTINGNVIIPAGQTWTVTGNTLRFGPNCWIIVQPTGKFYLNNATLDAACPDQWGGTVLEGVPNVPHTPASQGYAKLDTSTVRKARVAIACQGMPSHTNVVLPSYIQSKKNGLVYAGECKFQNNTKDADIRWGNVLAGNVRNDIFIQCHFEKDTTFFSSASNPRERIFIRGNGGTLFSDCTFINNHPDRLSIHAMTGIRITKGKPLWWG